MRLGYRVKTLREHRALTQRDLARKARVTQPYVALLESGARKSPSLPVLQRLAKALGVRVTALLE